VHEQMLCVTQDRPRLYATLQELLRFVDRHKR
jgi:hypothetical protein